MREAGSDDIAQVLAETDAVTCSALTYVESHAALARMHKGRRIGTADVARTRGKLETFWADVAVVDVTTAVVSAAAAVATTHALRAYDALQLASALEVAPDAFACWDDELRQAAAAERLHVVPHHRPRSASTSST